MTDLLLDLDLGAEEPEAWAGLFEAARGPCSDAPKDPSPTNLIPPDQALKAATQPFQNPGVLQHLRPLFQHRLERMRLKPPTLNPLKRPLHVRDLTPRAREVYDEICKDCPTDASILHICRLIEQGPCPKRKSSGRIVDSLVTTYCRYYDVHYYLDITDPENPTYISAEAYREMSDKATRSFMAFDIKSSYQNQMELYSKGYFDPFRRGIEVWHQLHDQRWIPMSLCQFRFFLWADRFRVFAFLEEHYDKIMAVQRFQHQQKVNQHTKAKTKKRKKRKRQVVVEPPLAPASSSFLVPHVRSSTHATPRTCTLHRGTPFRRRRPKRIRYPTVRELQEGVDVKTLFNQ